MIPRTKHKLIIMTCFLAAWCSSSSSHSFCYLKFDDHLSGILFLILSFVLKEMEISGLYYVFSLVGNDLVLCRLALGRSQEVDWSCYDGASAAFLAYQFNIGKVFHIPFLCANTSS